MQSDMAIHIEFAEGSLHGLDNAVPIALLWLAKESQCGVPRRVVAIEHPAPIGDVLQQ